MLLATVAERRSYVLPIRTTDPLVPKISYLTISLADDSVAVFGPKGAHGSTRWISRIVTSLEMSQPFLASSESGSRTSCAEWPNKYGNGVSPELRNILPRGSMTISGGAEPIPGGPIGGPPGALGGAAGG